MLAALPAYFDLVIVSANCAAACGENEKVPSPTRSATVEVQIPRSEEQNDQVAANESSENAQVPPPVRELVAKRLVELITNLVCAVLTYTGSIIEDVAWRTTAEEIGHVVSAVLALWRAELVEFARLAFDFSAVKFGDDHAANEACEGVELVQPHPPELGDLRLGDGDTTE